MTFSVVIPHRDRGVDWHRQANLDSAVQWWQDAGINPIVVDDGRTGDDHFCRSAAYNKGLHLADTDVIVFSEADLLVPIEQIRQGVELAAEKPGLVVPFSRFLAMSEGASDLVRARQLPPSDAEASQVRGERQSIGAVNIVSRHTMKLVGGQYDEQFEGHAYDDDAMERAFTICCGPTRFVDGPGWHQWHIPGAFFATPESSKADREATERDRLRWNLYRRAKTSAQIRELIEGVR